MASEDVLAGNAIATYVRMSLAALLSSGPFIGLLYAILMPFIGLTATATMAV